ncbi:MAG: family 43 glycosylhydrolase [Acidobacteria bacterium]|nr:family 43 glycosylhydrolase [Acidobacteriota bacterium]
MPGPAVLLAFALCACLSPAAGRQATYRNPVIAGDYPDPTIVRVGPDYWAAATTGGWAPHFALLRSRDLVNWEHVGYLLARKPAWAKGDFWAPEMVSDGGRILVYYTARRDEGPGKRGTLCVAVATAPAPAGPYTDRGPLVCEIPERAGVGSIDAFFVRDERGRPFLVWKADGNDAEPDAPTSIYAQRLSGDGARLLGRRREILRNTSPWERHVTEGSFILRRGGWFYHFYSGNACCGRGCEYALGVARARKLLGPWEKYPENPLVAANRDWRCPGHGSIVRTPDGRDFLLYHSYRQRRDTFGVGREAVLDEVTWNADGWPSINGGKGPSSTAPAPLGRGTLAAAEFFDDFNNAALGPEWQWPMNNPPTARVEAGGGSFLLLAPGRAAGADEYTGAVVARRTTSGDYTATALVDVRGLAAGARAGLSAYGWRDGALGVAAGGGEVVVWRREGREETRAAAVRAPGSGALYLRMTAEGGARYRFAFGTNGRDWTEVGGTIDGGHVEAARVALTTGGGPARFDWVRITPSPEGSR